MHETYKQFDHVIHINHKQAADENGTIAKHMKIAARVNMADRWELSSKLPFSLFQPLASYF